MKWQQPDLFALLHVAFSSCLKILALEPLEAVESSKAQRCFLVEIYEVSEPFKTFRIVRAVCENVFLLASECLAAPRTATEEQKNVFAWACTRAGQPATRMKLGQFLKFRPVRPDMYCFKIFQDVGRDEVSSQLGLVRTISDQASGGWASLPSRWT